MRLKIESDGTPTGTRVTNAETGELLECTSISFYHKADGIPSCEATVIFPKLSALVDKPVIFGQCPHCGNVKELTGTTYQEQRE